MTTHTGWRICQVFSPSGVLIEATFVKALPDFVLNMIIEHTVELMWVEVRTAAGIERVTYIERVTSIADQVGPTRTAQMFVAAVMVRLLWQLRWICDDSCDHGHWGEETRY